MIAAIGGTTRAARNTRSLDWVFAKLGQRRRRSNEFLTNSLFPWKIVPRRRVRITLWSLNAMIGYVLFLFVRLFFWFFNYLAHLLVRFFARISFWFYLGFLLCFGFTFNTCIVLFTHSVTILCLESVAFAFSYHFSLSIMPIFLLADYPEALSLSRLPSFVNCFSLFSTGTAWKRAITENTDPFGKSIIPPSYLFSFSFVSLRQAVFVCFAIKSAAIKNWARRTRDHRRAQVMDQQKAGELQATCLLMFRVSYLRGWSHVLLRRIQFLLLRSVEFLCLYTCS